MALSSFSVIVLLTCLACLLMQLFVSKKQTSHILFAVFCGSIAMVVVKSMSGDAIGPYKYIIGLGTVATCNCYWLLSRSLFRGKGAIASHHLALAFAISLLVFVKQGYLFASSTQLISVGMDSPASLFLTELTVLLSSCILVLSFWEGCRGYKSANKVERGQRLLFLATFGFAVLLSKLPQEVIGSALLAKDWLINSLILFVVINTQILLLWRYKTSKVKTTEINAVIHSSLQLHDAKEDGLNSIDVCAEKKLAKQVKSLLINQQLFLQANLKVGDIAKALDLPEYRISKALRNHLNAKNFNQYINELRIEYAQQILADASKQQWPVLVVGLESGFASVGPFTRAFKAKTGFTPNQYRQHHLDSLVLKTG